MNSFSAQPSPGSVVPNSPQEEPLSQPASDFPTTPLKQKQKTKARLPFRKLVFPLIIFLIIASLFTGFYFLSSRKKAEVKELAGKQVANFSKLEETYGKTLNLIKAPADEGGTEVQKLLGVKDGFKDPALVQEEGLFEGEVLGLEDNPEIIRTRQLIELYREAKKTAEEIKNLSQSVEEKYQSFPASLFLKSPEALLDETKEFSQDTITLMTYLDDNTSLSIELVTLGFEIGVSINEAILRGADYVAIENLQDKVREVDEMKTKAARIDTSLLPEELRQNHLESLAEFDMVKTLLEDILESLRRRDLQALVRSLESFIVEAATASETGVVQSVSFWQDNPTIRSTSGLKDQWQSFQAAL